MKCGEVLNIIFISPELPYPTNSGGRIYTWERLKQLSKKKNNIYLYALTEKDEFVDLDILSQVCTEVNVYDREKSYVKAILNISKPYSVISRFSKKMFYDIKNKIEQLNIDLIIIDMPEMLMNCPFNNNISKVITQHNIEYELFRSIYKNSKSYFRRIIYYFEYIKMKKFEEKFYNSDAIHGCTFISNKELRRFTNKFHNLKAICITQGYDINNIYNLKIINKNVKNNIIFTGKMDYEPNIQAVNWFCKDILPLIKNKINDVKFYIVGKNPTNQVKSLENNSVIVTGKVENMKEYFNKTNLSVIPLKSGGGVKIKLFEALGNGKIVVSTSKGIEGTNFKNNEHVLIRNRANEFAKACISALNYPENYCKMINDSLNLIKDNYSWDAIGERYNKFLNDLKQL